MSSGSEAKEGKEAKGQGKTSAAASEAREHDRILLQIKNYLRDEAVFGDLEGLQMDKARFDVAVLGSKGVGKTATILNLCDIAGFAEYTPSHGLSAHDMYWPFKRADGGFTAVHLRFWDVGVWCVTDERATLLEGLKKELPRADAALYVLSSTDYASFTRASSTIQSNAQPRPLPKVRLALMTRMDQWVRREVSMRDLASVTEKFAVPALSISNTQCNVNSHLKLDTRRLLNTLCSMLLKVAAAQQARAAERKSANPGGSAVQRP